MPGVSIVGSGNVGANTAFFVAEACSTDVVLIDVIEGISTGKALDMMEAAPLLRSRSRLSGSDSIEAIAGSEVVVIAAGAVRKPGTQRDALYGENAELVRSLAREVAKRAPKSVVIVATEPVDAMTALFVRESKLPRSQVMGIGGALDSARMRREVSRALGVSAENVTALVVGRHASDMIPLPAYTRIGGIPLPQLMGKSEVAAVCDRVVKQGDEIVRLAGRSSAYYGPGACVADLVQAVVENLGRVFSVSLVLEGEHGVRDVALSLPALVGKGGIIKILPVALTEEQKKTFNASAERVRGLLATGSVK